MTSKKTADEWDKGIIAEGGDVFVSIVGNNVDGSSMLLKIKICICGGNAWEQVLDGNHKSFDATDTKQGCRYFHHREE